MCARLRSHFTLSVHRHANKHNNRLHICIAKGHVHWDNESMLDDQDKVVHLAYPSKGIPSLYVCGQIVNTFIKSCVMLYGHCLCIIIIVSLRHIK